MRNIAKIILVVQLIVKLTSLKHPCMWKNTEMFQWSEFEAIIRRILKNYQSHSPLSTHALTLLTELTSFASNYAFITARQVMNFIRHNLESEFLVTDSRLSQPSKEWLGTWSQQHFYVDLLSELGINEEKKVSRYADILTYLKRARPLSVLATITKLSYDKRTDTVQDLMQK